MARPVLVRRWLVALLVLLLPAGAVTVVPTPASAVAPRPTSAVVVDVAAGVDPAAVAARAGVTPTLVFTEVTSGFAATVTPAQLATLQADVQVEAITADTVLGRIEPGKQSARPRSRPGTDPYAPPVQFEQYVTPEIRRIGAPASRTADIDGRDDRRVDADIAVLDGGLDPYHPDLNVAGGFDCVPGPKGDRGWYDRDGHGTLVAGFAAAVDNAIGVVGSAPGARVWGIRIADPSGYIRDSSVLCGLEWVIRNAGRIDVANLSFAGSGNLIGPCVDPKSLRKDKSGKRAALDRVHQKICRATARGVTVVAAAGNDAADASSYTPAAYPEVITVSAFTDYDGLPGGLAPVPEGCFPTEADDTFATFSNFGVPVDVSAPGVCVLSTLPGGQYGYVEGTSFAAPLVAGAAALLRAKQPSMAPATVRARIVTAATAGPIPGDPDRYPEGRLDVSTF